MLYALMPCANKQIEVSQRHLLGERESANHDGYL